MKYATLGDPHLGRKFRTGVPLDRVGDRENMVWKDFRSQVCNPGKVDLHVCMGDLFDKFVVPPEVVLKAVHIYREAAERNPKVGYVVIQGNHDASRDTSRKSSFDIFAELVAHIPNITVVTEVSEIGPYGFVPYDMFTPVEEQVAQLSNDLEVVFMHHDYTDFGGEHVIPTKQMAEKGLTQVVNGHDHLPRTETRHGVTVEIVGSMQPYTHAEDDDGSLYRTVRLDEIPEDCSNLNLRVLLQNGEDLPEGIDCLSIIAKRVSSTDDESLEADTEDFEKFDIRSALSEVLHPDVREEVMEQFDAV